jgi:co-chaperonin GroES (HSP10)
METKVRFKPNLDRILVEVKEKEETTTESGLVIPTGEDGNKYLVGIVVRENSKPLIREGAEVIFSKSAALEIRLGPKYYQIVKEKSVDLYTEV